MASNFTAKSRFAPIRPSHPAPSADAVYDYYCDACGAYNGQACNTAKDTARRTPHAVRVAIAAADAARPPCTCTHDVAWSGCFCAASE
jgi:hypothetical protein